MKTRQLSVIFEQEDGVAVDDYELEFTVIDAMDKIKGVFCMFATVNEVDDNGNVVLDQTGFVARKIVQVSGNIALCDDGTLWLFEVIDTSDESGKSTITNWKKIETPEDWG